MLNTIKDTFKSLSTTLDITLIKTVSGSLVLALAIICFLIIT